MVMNPLARRPLLHLWHGWAKPFLIVAVLLGAVRSAGADWNDVPSGSMQPTVEIGDRVFVNKLAYDLKVPFTTWHLYEWASPRRGDIVILYSPHDGRRLLKRVIGLPGDLLEVRNNRLILNGHAAPYPMNEGALQETLDGRSHAVDVGTERGPSAAFGPIVLREDQYFVMGDARGNSLDSRFFGPVPRSAILGRVTMVVLSLDYDRALRPRWDRFFTTLR
jgi:signal peptidase I